MTGRMEAISCTSASTYSLSWTDNAKETVESLRCQKPQDTPLRLYDIQDHQVVSKNNVCYAILSYVWKQWTRDDLQSIVEHMVRECGLGYVWVDAWCINQADQDEKVKEIGKMSKYYRQAAVGLVLLPDWTKSSDDVVAGIMLSQWSERVWTLQEGTLLSKALVVGHHNVADHRDYTSQLCSNTARHIPLAGSKTTEGKLYETFEEAWDDNDRRCSVKEDLVWGYTAVIKDAHKIVGKYGREWHSLLREAAEIGCITAQILGSGPPEKGTGRCWMTDTKPGAPSSNEFTLEISPNTMQQNATERAHFGAAEITDAGMVAEGTIVTVEFGEVYRGMKQVQLTSNSDGFVWRVDRVPQSILEGKGWRDGMAIIFTQEEHGGNDAVLIAVKEGSPGVYHRTGWAIVKSPRLHLKKTKVCIGHSPAEAGLNCWE